LSVVKDKDRHNRDLYLMSTTPVQIKKNV